MRHIDPSIDVVQRIGGAFLILVAVVVAVHTVVEPLYHTSRDGQPYSPLWTILDPLMVAAVAAGVIFAWLRKRAADGQRDGDAVTRTWLAANTLFYGLLFVAILLLWNWFNLLSPRFTAVGDETASLVWILIDALLPLLLGALGSSLLLGNTDDQHRPDQKQVSGGQRAGAGPARAGSTEITTP